MIEFLTISCYLYTMNLSILKGLVFLLLTETLGGLLLAVFLGKMASPLADAHFYALIVACILGLWLATFFAIRALYRRYQAKLAPRPVDLATFVDLALYALLGTVVSFPLGAFVLKYGWETHDNKMIGFGAVSLALGVWSTRTLVHLVGGETRAAAITAVPQAPRAPTLGDRHPRVGGAVLAAMAGGIAYASRHGYFFVQLAFLAGVLAFLGVLLLAGGPPLVRWLDLRSRALTPRRVAFMVLALGAGAGGAYLLAL